MPRTITISDETWSKIKDQVSEDETKPIKELNDLVGQVYTFWCARYIYHGKVKEVNSTYITLEDAAIVYETGEFTAKSPVDMQELPKGCQIMWNAVESFIALKW